MQTLLWIGIPVVLLVVVPLYLHYTGKNYYIRRYLEAEEKGHHPAIVLDYERRRPRFYENLQECPFWRELSPDTGFFLKGRIIPVMVRKKTYRGSKTLFMATNYAGR